MEVTASSTWSAEKGFIYSTTTKLPVPIVEAAGQKSQHQAKLVLKDHLLLPGFVNAHSHAFQRAFRGQVQHKEAGKDDFWGWRERMYGVAQSLDPQSIRAISALAFLEMLEAGFTSVVEFHYVQHQPDGRPYDDPDEMARAVIAAAQDVGIRLTLLRVAYHQGGFGQPLSSAQRRFSDPEPQEVLRAISRLQKDHETVTVGLAVHSVRAVSPQWMEVLSGFGGVVHAHVSEQPAENEACMKAMGMSPLQLLHRHHLLSPRFTAVHLTHPMEGDLELLAEVGAAICICPSTELDLGDGFLPVEARKLPLCIGSDSHALIDPFEELRAVEAHARAMTGRRVVIADEGPIALPLRLLEIAHTQGLASAGQTGEGDFIAIDLSRPSALGVPPEHAILAARPEWVKHVWVRGEHLVRNGAHQRRKEIIERARRFLG